MKVARFSVLDFSSRKDLDAFLVAYKKAKFLETAETHCVTQTGESSLLIFSVYPDQETASENVQDRQIFVDSVSHLLGENFFYEGEIKHYVTGKGKDMLVNSQGADELTSENLNAELYKEVSELKAMTKQMLNILVT